MSSEEKIPVRSVEFRMSWFGLFVPGKLGRFEKRLRNLAAFQNRLSLQFALYLHKPDW